LAEPIVTSQVAIGACLNCRQLFLITPDTETCYLCGRLPAYTIGFPPASVHEPWVLLTYPEELPPEQPPVLIGVTCPHCHNNVQLSISNSEISVLPPPAPEPQEEEQALPTTEELSGSDPQFTGPLTTEEYLDGIRGKTEVEQEDDRTTVLSP